MQIDWANGSKLPSSFFFISCRFSKLFLFTKFHAQFLDQDWTKQMVRPEVRSGYTLPFWTKFSTLSTVCRNNGIFPFFHFTQIFQTFSFHTVSSQISLKIRFLDQDWTKQLAKPELRSSHTLPFWTNFLTLYTVRRRNGSKLPSFFFSFYADFSKLSLFTQFQAKFH